MDAVSKEIIEVLTYLLPGLITAWIYYGLTPYQKPSEFERIVQALIFTIFVQGGIAIVNLLVNSPDGKKCIPPEMELVISIAIAIALGLLIVFFANNDYLHWVLRKLKFTRESSRPSSWYSAFYKSQTFVVLHLFDGRRIMGLLKEWPNQPDEGHFIITKGEWLTEDNKRFPWKGVEFILFPAKEVKFVEFMKK